MSTKTSPRRTARVDTRKRLAEVLCRPMLSADELVELTARIEKAARR